MAQLRRARDQWEFGAIDPSQAGWPLNWAYFARTTLETGGRVGDSVLLRVWHLGAGYGRMPARQCGRALGNPLQGA